MNREYSPAHARGVRFDDPEIGVTWPEGERIVSERDRHLPLLSDP
jgi:dTDP-4-dehydrorhamnose 3,5-epimerase